MHVLLLEPDTLLADCYRWALETSGHDVRHARTAQTAISLADETTPDLVILEIAGARHNGIEFLYEFRSYFEWLTIPVLVLSDVPAVDLTYNTTLLHQLGVSDILAKANTDLRQLVSKVAAMTPAPDTA